MFKLIIPILILCLIIIVLVKIENQKYLTSIQIKPGLKYKVGNKIYTVPDLDLQGTAFLLRESFMLKIRDLYSRTHKIFEEEGIVTWLSGGTLLGFVRHETFMPWDDDIDIHTSSENRVRIFSKEFRQLLKSRGIDALLMIGSNENKTFYKGGLRLRFSGTKNPVMDIFFVDRGTRKTQKIENWYGSKIEYNVKENWYNEEVFPIKKTKIDDLEVNLPNKPGRVLEAQYGKDYDKKMYCQHPPHHVAFDLLDVIWNY